jgi:hypothetical protein
MDSKIRKLRLRNQYGVYDINNRLLLIIIASKQRNTMAENTKLEKSIADDSDKFSCGVMKILSILVCVKANK